MAQVSQEENTTRVGITERVGVGTISNMFEILEAVTGADKVLSV